MRGVALTASPSTENRRIGAGAAAGLPRLRTMERNVRLSTMKSGPNKIQVLRGNSLGPQFQGRMRIWGRQEVLHLPGMILMNRTPFFPREHIYNLHSIYS